MTIYYVNALKDNKLFETAFYSLSIKPLPIICNSAEWRVVVHADVITCVCLIAVQRKQSHMHLRIVELYSLLVGVVRITRCSNKYIQNSTAACDCDCVGSWICKIALIYLA